MLSRHKNTKIENAEIHRRDFVAKCAVATVVAGVSIGSCGAPDDSIKRYYQDENRQPHPSQWWEQGKWVDQKSARIDENTGIIEARIENKWRRFNTVELPTEFVNWSFNKRIERLDKLAKEGFNPEDLDGPHNACVASYGGWARDSLVSINTAYKGMGFLPKKDKIEETIDEIVETRKKIAMEASNFFETMKAKTEYLAKLYQNIGLFDLTKQISLELFTTSEYATHTFLNIMANPIVSASFLAYPTFEIRAIAKLLHHQNPGLTEYEKNTIRYVNNIHDFVHSGGETKMACVYHVIEVFDDTPNQNAPGRKLV